MLRPSTEGEDMSPSRKDFVLPWFTTAGPTKHVIIVECQWQCQNSAPTAKNNNQHVEATGRRRGHAPIKKGRCPPLNHHCKANGACHCCCRPVMMPELGPNGKKQLTWTHHTTINMLRPLVEGEDMPLSRKDDVLPWITTTGPTEHINIISPMTMPELGPNLSFYSASVHIEFQTIGTLDSKTSMGMSIWFQLVRWFSTQSPKIMLLPPQLWWKTWGLKRQTSDDGRW